MTLDPLAPIRLGFRIGIGVLRFELRVVEHLLGFDRPQPDIVVPEPEAFTADPAPPRQPRAPAAPAAPPQAEPPAPVIAVVPEPEPEPQPEEEPAHIDTEPELVGEFAEPGAEDGAGA